MSRKAEYNVSREIRERLAGFKSQLKEKGFSKDTIRQKVNYVAYFLQYLERENIEWNQAIYGDMLGFIDYCREEGNSRGLINSKLRSVRQFYQYQKEIDPRINNPALNLIVRGEYKKLPSGNFPFKMLEAIYKNHSRETLRDKRNKAIFGLLIYQGITTGELQRLGADNLQLSEQRIFIPGSRRSGSRYLQLREDQTKELKDYRDNVRPKILKGISDPTPSRKPDQVDYERIKDQLFISMGGSADIRSSMLHLFRNIQETHPEIKNAKQIRSSVITHWLKHYNLRQVQYMAGHKHVSSTERYKQNNLDQLQSKLEKYHPLEQ